MAFLESAPSAGSLLRRVRGGLWGFRGSVNSGFQIVVRVRSGEQIPALHFNLNVTSM